MEKDQINKSLRVSIDIIKAIKIFIGFLFVITIASVIIALIYNNNPLISELDKMVENEGIPFRNSLAIYIVISAIYSISLVILYFVLDKGKKTLELIINETIFNQQVIDELAKIIKLLIAYYVATIISTFTFALPVLSLIIVIGIVREIFIYGQKLEEEISEVI